MTPFEIIPFDEGEARLDWIGLTDALAAGHKLPKATVEDSFLYRGTDTLLSRAAWIDGLGLATKAATIFPGGDGPAVNGAFSLFSDHTGVLEAMVDFHLVTKWKTAGDSLLAARHLAPADSRTILIIGAGTVAQSLRAAYGALFPQAQFLVWNRTAQSAQTLAQAHPATTAVTDLPQAVAQADIVTCATMSTDPVLRGDWLRPGQHIDLIGAYRPDMREADDDVIRRGKIFVDSFDTTLGHIGELKTPLAEGVITRDDIAADYYALDKFTRAPDDITVFKNGGGAHLDLMTGKYILQQWTDA